MKEKPALTVMEGNRSGLWRSVIDDLLHLRSPSARRTLSVLARRGDL